MGTAWLARGTGWKFGAGTRIKRPLRLLSLVIETAEAYHKFAMKQSPRYVLNCILQKTQATVRDKLSTLSECEFSPS